MLLLPCLDSITDKLVIQQATFFNVRRQDFLLFFRRAQSVFEGFKHNKNIHLCIIFCQPIFRGMSGRITMTHRPQSLDECAPTLLHHPISMSLRKQGFDGVYGLSDKKKKNRRIDESTNGCS